MMTRQQVHMPAVHSGGCLAPWMSVAVHMHHGV